jgi:hypothetical protein
MSQKGAGSRTRRHEVAALEDRGACVSLVRMKRRLLLIGLGSFVLLFAVAGWTVDGLRWAVTPLRPA